MVVDDVEEHGDPRFVGRFHERLEIVRGTVARLDRERVGGVVAPRPFAGELERWHQLDCAHSESAEVVEPILHALERPRSPVHPSRERADVKLVDHEVIPIGRPELGALPGEVVGSVDDRVAGRAREPPRSRVDSGEHAVAGPDRKAILIAVGRAGYVGRPRSAVLGRHRISRRVPVVERADDRDRLRVRSPHPERDAAVERNRAHAGAGRGEWDNLPWHRSDCAA